MKKRHNRKPELFRRIAIERIFELFGQAERRFSKDPCLSDRYVELARLIAMKYKVKIPREFKRRYCKNCHKFFVPGINCRVRLSQGRVIYTCFSCKSHIRIPFKKK